MPQNCMRHEVSDDCKVMWHQQVENFSEAKTCDSLKIVDPFTKSSLQFIWQHMKTDQTICNNRYASKILLILKKKTNCFHSNIYRHTQEQTVCVLWGLLLLWGQKAAHTDEPQSYESLKMSLGKTGSSCDWGLNSAPLFLKLQKQVWTRE